MGLESQKSWKWPIACYLFLAAAGSGQFLISLILYAQDLYFPLVRVALIMGPIVVAMATAFLIIDAGVKTKALQLWSLVSNWRASWMARGSVILILFIILGLVYSLPGLWFEWWYSTWFPLGVIVAVLAIFTAIYTALLIGACKAIPFWNSAVLPPLFVLSALSTGIALLLFVVPFIAMPDKASALHTFASLDIAFISLEILTLFGYLEIGRRQNITFAESVNLLVRGPLAFGFFGGFLLLGLIAPLILEVYSFTPGLSYSIISGLGIASSVLLLFGGYLLRYLILRAGVKLSLYPV